MPAETAGGIMEFIQTWGLMIVMVILLVVMMIVPQRKQNKKVKEMMESLAPGVRVRTIGGFYGRIVQVKADMVVLEMEPDKTRMTLTKGAISTVENSDVENDTLPEAAEPSDKK